jgi:hypothetical protein
MTQQLAILCSLVVLSGCPSPTPCAYEVAPDVCGDPLDDAGVDLAATDDLASVDEAEPPDLSQTEPDLSLSPDLKNTDLICAGLPDGDAPQLSAGIWMTGLLNPASLPPRSELQLLPGGGVGNPVVTSNNPEVFTGEGLLYGTARASATRGGVAYPLSGTIGVYLHHINRMTMSRYVSLLVENPSATDTIKVSAHGSGYTQDETGGLPIGGSPDYKVSDEWIRSQPNTVLAETDLAPGGALIVFQRLVGDNREIDGRFDVIAGAPVFISVVASHSAALADVRVAAAVDAPGMIAVPGNPPPPFGREAGTYAKSIWQGTIDTAVPPAGKHLGFMVNTATGAGFPQIQAFAALTHYSDSAREAVGMYGNVYDVTIRLWHDGSDCAQRKVRVSFASLSTAAPSRYWDGVCLFDGVAQTLRNTPAERVDILGEMTLPAAGSRVVSFKAMVPGLTSIPQALYLESL